MLMHCRFLQLGALYANIRHDPKSKYIIGRKVSVVIVNKAGGSRGVLNRGFRVWSTLKRFLGSKKHLDWLKIDLNMAEIITVQDYKHKKIM